MRKFSVLLLIVAVLAVPLVAVQAQSDDGSDINAELIALLEENQTFFQTTPGFVIEGSGTDSLVQNFDVAGELLVIEETTAEETTLTIVNAADGTVSAAAVSTILYLDQPAGGAPTEFGAETEARYVDGDVYFIAETFDPEAEEPLLPATWVQLDSADDLLFSYTVFSFDNWFDPEQSLIDFSETIERLPTIADITLTEEDDGSRAFELELTGEAFVDFFAADLADDPEASENFLIQALLEQALLPDNESRAYAAYIFDADGRLRDVVTETIIDVTGIDLVAALPDAGFPDGSFVDVRGEEIVTSTVTEVDVALAPFTAPEGFDAAE
jgi:hypothetical protein